MLANGASCRLKPRIDANEEETVFTHSRPSFAVNPPASWPLSLEQPNPTGWLAPLSPKFGREDFPLGSKLNPNFGGEGSLVYGLCLSDSISLSSIWLKPVLLVCLAGRQCPADSILPGSAWKDHGRLPTPTSKTTYLLTNPPIRCSRRL